MFELKFNFLIFRYEKVMTLLLLPKIKATFVSSWLVNYLVLSEIKLLSNKWWTWNVPYKVWKLYYTQAYTVASTTSETCHNQNLGRYTRMIKQTPRNLDEQLTSSFKIKQQNWHVYLGFRNRIPSKQKKIRSPLFHFCLLSILVWFSTYFWLFDYKTADQLGCVSVRLRAFCLVIRVYRLKFWLSSDTFRSLLMLLYRPVYNKVSKLCMARFMFIIYLKGA